LYFAPFRQPYKVHFAFNILKTTFFIVSGVKEIHGTGPTLNNNKWHQVHLFRYGDHANMTIDNIPVVVERKYMLH